MPLLSVSQFVAYRRGAALFSPTNFSLGVGESALITGENGTGKTTLLECIAGLYCDWTGEIRGSHRAQISYLQQTPHCVRTLPLSSIARLVVGFTERRYEELLCGLKLEDKKNDLMSVLSGGELQRARLLLTLLRRHLVLLLDEPFANLDDQSRSAINCELEKTRSSRATVVVTHVRDARGVLLDRSVNIALCRHHC